MKRIRYKQSEVRALAIIAAAGSRGLSFVAAKHGVRSTTIKALLTGGLASEARYDAVYPYYVTLTDAGRARLLQVLRDVREARYGLAAAEPFQPSGIDIRQCLLDVDLPEARIAELVPRLLDAFSGRTS